MIYRAEDAVEKLTEVMSELNFTLFIRAHNCSTIQHVIFENYMSVGVTVLSQQPFSFYWDVFQGMESNMAHLLSLFRSSVDYSVKGRCLTLLKDYPDSLPVNWEEGINAMLAQSYLSSFKVNIPENIDQKNLFNIVLFHSFKMPRWHKKMPFVVTTILDMPFEWPVENDLSELPEV